MTHLLQSPILDSMEAGDLMRTQHRLRGLLLEKAASLDHSAQELASRMLLYLDQPDRCWTVATEWLIRAVDVERVDGGWTTPVEETYKAGQFETLREPGLVSIRGLVVNSSHRALRKIWSSLGPVVHEDMERSSLFDNGLRQYFLGRGIHTKMTAALVNQGKPVGLICVDRLSSSRRWTQSQYECFATITQRVMPPILAEAQRLSSRLSASRRGESEDAALIGKLPLDRLTSAEFRVCQLATQGLSYKEICRLIDRSFSTIDHQLRSIRRKLGVASTARLITLLALHRQELMQGARSNVGVAKDG